jgi:hypothetical protein
LSTAPLASAMIRRAVHRTARGQERAGRSDGIVEVIEDRGAVDQDLAVIEHE